MTPLRTVAEAAALLGVSESWLQKKVAARLIPHTRLGRSVRFSDEHLAQIIATGEQGQTVVPLRGGRAVRRVA